MKTVRFMMHLNGAFWGLNLAVAASRATTGEYLIAAAFFAVSCLSLHVALKSYVLLAEYYHLVAVKTALEELTRRMK